VKRKPRRNYVPVIFGTSFRLSRGLRWAARKKSQAMPRCRTVGRTDARRNIDALLGAARAVFLTSGVDAPVREIAEKAGVGIGTLSRHFPRRADLIVGVFRREVDACPRRSVAPHRKSFPSGYP